MTDEAVERVASVSSERWDPAALARRAELLFTHDERGRLLRVRETMGPVAPRFYFARGVAGEPCNAWRFRADLPRDLIVALGRLAGQERPMHADAASLSLPPPPERVEAFRQLLREDAPIRQEYRGPAFRFPSSLQHASEPGSDGELIQLDAAREADRALMAQAIEPPGAGRSESDPDPTLAWLARPSPLLPQTDCFAIVRGGEVVSACWTARFMAGAGAEAGVRTRESQQGHGFALRVVAAWARAMRASGTEPLYSTEWTNKASRGLARRLGLRCYGEDLHFD